MSTVARKLGEERHPKTRNFGSRWADPDTFALCRRLYLEEGVSATQTAKRLGPEFTRNMVISLAYREGWRRAPEVGRQNIVRNAKRGREWKAARPSSPPVEIGSGHVRTPKEPKPQPVRQIGPQEIPVTAKPWVERAPVGECAWPIEVNGETWSCCQPVGHDSPAWAYCPSHAALMRRRYDTAKKPMSADELVRSCRRYA